MFVQLSLQLCVFIFNSGRGPQALRGVYPTDGFSAAPAFLLE